MGCVPKHDIINKSKKSLVAEKSYEVNWHEKGKTDKFNAVYLLEGTIRKIFHNFKFYV